MAIVLRVLPWGSDRMRVRSASALHLLMGSAKQGGSVVCYRSQAGSSSLPPAEMLTLALAPWTTHRWPAQLLDSGGLVRLAISEFYSGCGAGAPRPETFRPSRSG